LSQHDRRCWALVWHCVNGWLARNWILTELIARAIELEKPNGDLS
jgi:hypothetical protein